MKNATTTTCTLCKKNIAHSACDGTPEIIDDPAKVADEAWRAARGAVERRNEVYAALAACESSAALATVLGGVAQFCFDAAACADADDARAQEAAALMKKVIALLTK